MAPPKTLKRISPIYKIYFLYLEPLMAFGGSILIVSQPERFLERTVPGNALTVHPLSVTPVVHMLLMNISSMYLLIALLEGVVLRLSRERNVWLGILAALVLSDIGHLYAVYKVAPEMVSNIAAWSFDEWINYGTLLGGLVLRVLFIGGWGRG